MILANLKKYLRCHKYYFVPLGILSIFVVIGLTVSVNGIVVCLKDFFTQVGEMAKNVKLDWNVIWQTLLSEMSKIDYAQTAEQLISSVTSSDWLTNLLKAVVKAIFGEEIAQQAVGLIQTTIQSIMMWLTVFFALFLIGLVVGFLVLKILVRKELTKVKVGKLILFAVLDSLFWGAIIMLLTFLTSSNKVVSIIVMIVFIISLMFICLLEGYLFYGIKKVKFKEAMKVRNVLTLYLISLIIIAIAASIVALLFLIFNPVIAIYIGFPFVEIAIASISLIAESYVVELVEKNNPEPVKKLKTSK